jgi:argininosuccinate lyase
MGSKMLRGRFKGGIAPALLEYSSSLETDKEMFSEDVWGSKAHVLMLAKQGIISREDAGKILKALVDVEKEYSGGKFQLDENLEDIHINIENYVIGKCGIDYGGRMHTARSRNDQVLTDTKLHLRKELLGVVSYALVLQKTLLDLADKNAATIMPGYTHTQHAQPITFGYWASSYASMLMRDLDRLNGAYAHVNTCPLGSGALSGTSFPTDREYAAKLLGFDSVHVHALDAVSSRDHILETLAALSILMCNLSKLAEELVLWSSYEFRFIEFSDGFATGSSIMPQKKNPDMAELVRGKTGRVYGALFQVLTLMKGLPSGYNRDMQEDRELLWNALSVVKGSLTVLNAGLSDAKINKVRMSESVYADYSTATELANYLVRERGIAFRKAYEITRGIVKDLSTGKKDFIDIRTVLSLLKKEGVEISSGALSEILDPAAVASRNNSLGGTAPSEVKRMVKHLRERTAAWELDINKKEEKTEAAKKTTEKAIKELL